MKALDFYKKRLKDMGFSEKQIKDLTNYKELPDANKHKCNCSKASKQ